MLRSTSDNQRPPKWALALRREMQMAIGQQLRTERELPQETPPELTALLSRREDDPYADVGNGLGPVWAHPKGMGASASDLRLRP